jgi:hypothetical protein
LALEGKEMVRLGEKEMHSALGLGYGLEFGKGLHEDNKVSIELK